MIKKYFILFIFALSVFSCSKYSKGDKERFIPLKEMKTDYEYFWDFIDKGYPNKNVCIKNGADLKAIKTYYSEKLKTVKNETEYIKLYNIICYTLTNSRNFGHLSVVDYSTYKNEIAKVSLEDKRDEDIHYIKKDIRVDDFYEKGLGTNTEYMKAVQIYEKQKEDIEKFVFKEINNNPNAEHRCIKPSARIKNDIFYIKIPAFSSTKDFDWNDFEKYQKEITKNKYKHLIIDLRNNGGGHTFLWRKFLVAPLLKEAKTFKTIALYNPSEFSDHYIPFFLKGDRWSFPAKISKRKNLPFLENLNKKEAASFKEYYDVTYTVESQISDFQFDGKIWVLINKKSYSASDAFAAFCKQTGFASLVGENTGGSGLLALHPVYLKFPRSGLLIKYDMFYTLNPDGSNNAETGTAPDYPVKQKYALKACLEIIDLFDNCVFE